MTEREAILRAELKARLIQQQRELLLREPQPTLNGTHQALLVQCRRNLLARAELVHKLNAVLGREEFTFSTDGEQDLRLTEEVCAEIAQRARELLKHSTNLLQDQQELFQEYADKLTGAICDRA